MGGVALRFCLVLGRVLMVVYCCAAKRRWCRGALDEMHLDAFCVVFFVGGVALRFCLVLLMVCFGCVCVVLELVPRVVVRRLHWIAEAATLDADASGSPIFSRCSLVVALAV